MYKDYFGFSDSPFENNLDQRFLFFSANHKEVSAALLYFIKMKKGFALVCGDVGTGKTMLINYLLNKLPNSVHPIMIMNPDVGYMEILKYVAGVLNIDFKGKRVLELVDLVKTALVEASRQGRRFVLIIDEAHLLSDRSIEQIRLLSNIETQEHKLFQILLLGQYELSYKLNRSELRQLRQRINVNRFLAPMDAAETIQYIDHRLRMAGSAFDACFEPDCKKLIFKMTHGVPRSINQLCDSALLACMAEKRKKVSRKILKTAGAAIKSDVIYTPRHHARHASLSWRTILPWFALGGCVVMLFVALWIFGYLGWLGERAQGFLQHGKHSPIPQTVQTPSQRLTVPAETVPAVIPAPEKEAAAKLPSPEKPVAINQSVTPPPETTNPPRPAETPATLAEPAAASNDRREPLAEKSVQMTPPPPAKKGSFRLVVKDGDTLMGIASWYYPKNIEEGLKKILAANPSIDNRNRILKGQEVIIPEPDVTRKDRD